MNAITLVETYYLRSNRTIESILLKNRHDQKMVYVYNYEGVHFRLFLSLIQIIDFFNNGKEPEYDFEKEHNLDKALIKLDITDNHSAGWLF